MCKTSIFVCSFNSSQRKKAAEISAEVAAFDEELRIQTVELARLNIVNAAAEDRIKVLLASHVSDSCILQRA